MLSLVRAALTCCQTQAQLRAGLEESLEPGPKVAFLCMWWYCWESSKEEAHTHKKVHSAIFNVISFVVVLH